MALALAALLVWACTYPNEAYEQGEILCANGSDDDGDGLVDCLDPSCGDATTCQGSDADTDADTDADADSDTDADADSDTDADADSDTDADADSDTDSDTDADTDTLVVPGGDCEGDGWCLSDHCDHDVCCESGTCCAADNDAHCSPYDCDLSSYQCLAACAGEDDGPCADGFHCEAGACAANLADGQGCDETSDCASGHCDNGYCCLQGTCCATGADCDGESAQPVCHGTDFECVACHEADVDGDAACAAAWPAQPVCDPSDGMCAECVDHADCKEGSTAPWNSPVGVCAPDRTCTCWTNATASWSCFATTDCPGGFTCARDFGGVGHYVCLRQCTPAVVPVEGMTCELRLTAETTNQLVWAPMTTCYAFSKFGADCSGDVHLCSVDGENGLDDGTCVAGDCTYSCWDGAASQDVWCPNSDCDVQYCAVP
jgi:hypothetical protein